MKNKELILVLVILIIVSALVTMLISDSNKGQDAPYLNLVYSPSEGPSACLEFYKNGKYSLFDCDSEPTDYFFDSENECTYKYSKMSKRITFDCIHKTKYKNRGYIEVLEWDNKHIKFDYEGEIKTFYSRNNNY